MRVGKDVAGFFEEDWGNGDGGHDFVYEERQPEFFDWGHEGWMTCKRCGARKRVRSRLISMECYGAISVIVSQTL